MKTAEVRKKKVNRISKTQTAKRPFDLREQTRTPYLASSALVILVLAIYANSLGNNFVFDDQYLVLIYSRPRDFSHLLQMLLDSYRPVRNLSYMIDFFFWGAKPFGFHLTNVLLHAANSVLVFHLARRFQLESLTAFFAALIFAVHPIQTDAVTYISGRRDVLFTLFYLAGFLSYLKYRSDKSYKYFGLFLVCWGLGLMAKEMAVSLPLVIFIWNFCALWKEESGSGGRRLLAVTRKALGQDKWLYLALTLAAVAFTWYMLFVRNASGRVNSEGVTYWGGSFLATMLTVLRVHVWYVKQLLYPTPIAQYFGAFEISTSLLDWRALAALIIIGSMVTGGFLLLKRNPLMAFAVLAYFAMLLPVSQLIPHHELLADHYLYLPMMSFSLIAALVIKMFAAPSRESRKVVYGVAIALICLLGVMTIFRNRDWKDELALWQANYEAVPNSPRAATNLGSLLMRNDPQQAEAILRQAIASDPTFEPAYLSLAQLYITQKRTAEAEEMIQTGSALVDQEKRSYILRNPSLLKSQFTTLLAISKSEAGDRQATEQLLRQAIAEYPFNVRPYETLANVYQAQDRFKEEEVLQQALAAVPSAYDLYARLAALRIEAKRYDEALSDLQKMLTLSPNENDCRKARPYLGTARSKTPMEQRIIVETLRNLEQQCSGL